jgi:ABC-type nickel/cobalt efflux system permease component RcnA
VKERIHFHVHQHVDGIQHFHAHGHAGEALLGQSAHDPACHDHSHPRGFPLRALLVGLMHGMAGSAALVLLTVETLRSFPLGLAYIVVFGLGSIVGMALLSVVIALPLRLSSRYLTWSYNGLSAGVGLLTLLLGVGVIYRIGVTEGLLV